MWRKPKTGFSVLTPNPASQQRGRARPLTLNAAERLADLHGLDVVFVEVEAPPDPGRPGQDDRGNGASRRIPMAVEETGKRRRHGPELVAEVVPHAVLRGKEVR